MDPERLARQINQDLNTSRFQRHARELGEEVVHAESHFEEHLHSVFDHQLGRLGEGSAPKPGEAGIPATAAAGLAAMLADAQSLRQAIVLSEILSRPEHRWE